MNIRSRAVPASSTVTSTATDRAGPGGLLPTPLGSVRPATPTAGYHSVSGGRSARNGSGVRGGSDAWPSRYTSFLCRLRPVVAAHRPIGPLADMRWLGGVSYRMRGRMISGIVRLPRLSVLCPLAGRSLHSCIWALCPSHATTASAELLHDDYARITFGSCLCRSRRPAEPLPPPTVTASGATVSSTYI
jgi:hypothetical protein